jgi:hypothetical protein
MQAKAESERTELIIVRARRRGELASYVLHDQLAAATLIRRLRADGMRVEVRVLQ